MEVKWLNGCEMCNTGIVVEVKSLQKEGLSVRAATEVMHETAYQKYPELKEEFSAGKIRNRYNYHMRCLKPTIADTTNSINNNSELEKKTGGNKKKSEVKNNINAAIFKRVNQVIVAKRWHRRNYLFFSTFSILVFRDSLLWYA